MSERIVTASLLSAPVISDQVIEDALRLSPLHTITHCWNGQPASDQLATAFGCLWTMEELILNFECHWTQLDMDNPAAPFFDSARERFALWEQDVCEAFIQPTYEKQAYREFQAAPNGQWCDLIIDRRKMLRDWEWKSGMKVFTKVDEVSRIWNCRLRIPFSAFARTPVKGDQWQANFFRIARLNNQRQFLTYVPTLTPVPNFHVSEAFVPLKFK
jgi:hypothetical protein